MSNLTPEEALKTLTQTEAYVLYWVCKGLPYKFIARNKVPFGVDMVQTHMSNVYSKLGIDNSMHALKRRKILEQVFCPALMKLCKGDPENIKKNWPPDDPNPRPDPRTLAIVIYEQGRQDAEEEQREEKERLRKELASRGHVEIIDPNAGKSTKKPNYSVFVVVVCVVACIAIAASSGITYYILHNQPPQEKVVPVIQTQLVAAPTNSPLPTYTFQPTQTFRPTYTPLPAPVHMIPTQTSIPTNTPTPIITLPFSDNFSKGINPPWQVYSGNWIVDSFGATITIKDLNENPTGAIVLDDPTLTNYRLRVKVHSPHVLAASQGSLGVVVRYRSDHDQNLIFYMNSASRMKWGYISSLSNLEFNLPPVTSVDNADIVSNFTFEIDVSGNTFIAKVDGEKFDNFTMSGYETGGIALVTSCGNVGSCPSFSNFSLEPLQ